MLRAEDYEQGRYEEKKEITVQERNLWENVPAQDENYQSFIVRYNQNVEGTVQYESDRTFQIIDDMFGVTYVPASQVPEPLISSFSYFSLLCTNKLLRCFAAPAIITHMYLLFSGTAARRGCCPYR